MFDLVVEMGRFDSDARWAGMLGFQMRRHSRGAAAMGLGLVVALVQAKAALAAPETVPLPFERGAAARVAQGYNGGSHVGPSRFGLDLVLTDQPTSGAAVLSPFDGSVTWAFPPGDRTGCIQVLAPDRSFGVMLCHVVLDRPYARGEKVSRGQVLGAVGEPGSVGNNGLAHVHLELHVAGRDADPVPFSPTGGGLTLDGIDLPETPADDLPGTRLVSSNLSLDAHQ